MPSKNTGRSGLNLERIIISNQVLSESLANVEKSIYKHTGLGKQSQNIAKALIKFLNIAIKNCDVPTIFCMEKTAIASDMLAYGAEEKRIGSLASLDQAMRLVEGTSTPEGAQEYLKSMNGGVLPKSVPKTDLVLNFIRNQKSQISQLATATASPALKLYRVRRKDALELVRKEYIKNLELGLGINKSKDRGLSR